MSEQMIRTQFLKSDIPKSTTVPENPYPVVQWSEKKNRIQLSHVQADDPYPTL